MILRLGVQTWCGGVVDLRETDVNGAAIARAIRGDPSAVGVHAQPPREVHDRAGFVRPGMGLATRTALAAAGRSRGMQTPHDEELASVRDELDALGTGQPQTPKQSTPSAGPVANRERLRERVAELRGRIQALTADGRDASDERERLRNVARQLSELETERIAATERRGLLREYRDRRERRLGLEDREANLARDARAHLVDELTDEYVTALGSLASERDGATDGNAVDGDPSDGDPIDADPVTAALAVLRVATVRAPVLLAVDRFESPAEAARWLGAPVVRL